ncbi:hypothetical protein ACG97_02020 [Vogesella sp. EB]|nr:hypothetical protein ACG97_02020 [Vogesella sp. EB]
MAGDTLPHERDKAGKQPCQLRCWSWILPLDGHGGWYGAQSGARGQRKVGRSPICTVMGCGDAAGARCATVARLGRQDRKGDPLRVASAALALQSVAAMQLAAHR